MNAALALTVGLARCWVALYTARLPLAIRDSRRSEIDSDLWEQQWLAARRGDPAIGTAIEVLSRTLLGIFDDLMWRLEAGAPITKGRTSVNDTLPMRIGFIIAIVPLALLAVAGISFLLGNGDFDNTTGHWVWRGFFVASPIVGGIGLWLCAARPKLGMALAVLGVGASAVVMPWMAPITVPAGIAIIAFAIKRSGLAIWPFRPGTPRAA